MFKIFICFLSLIVSSIQNGLSLADSWENDLLKIVGGEDAKEGEFPYQVSLRYRGATKIHFCGGSIISEKVVLTAGHCVTEAQIPPYSYIEVAAGTITLKNESPNVQKSTILKSIVHPKYQGKVNPFDLAIHILTQPFVFNKFVQPIALPKQNEEPTGKGILTGWGSVSRNTFPVMPDTLQKVTLPLMSYEECAEWYKREKIHLNKISNICTHSTIAHLSACSGDSGGPLVSLRNGTKTIIGIVSWGKVPCGSGSPSVYTKVSSFVNFIQENISLQ